ncbi:MAG: phospholipase C, phosphocholine-specific [Polyangiales bacterium]
MTSRSIRMAALGALVLAACSSDPPAGDAGARADADAIAKDNAPAADAAPDADVASPMDAPADVADDASPDVASPMDAPADAPPDAPADVTAPMDARADVAPSDAPADVAPDLPPGLTGTIRDVRHVVIFIQENRSFDEYFGALSGVRGFGDPAAMTLRTGLSVFHQPSGTGELLPYHSGLDCVNDVDHGWASGHDAWHGGAWDRWVPAKGPTALSTHDRRELAYYYALADAYTTLDAYHCSVMGPTNPNRLYLMTGTIDATATGGGPVTDNTEPAAGFTWTTYPERLQAAGVSWKTYQAFDNFDDNALAWFRPFIQSRAGEPLFERGMRRLSDYVGEFRNDVMNGTLPQVSWIIAPTALSEHPPYPLSGGQNLTQRILDALASNPEVARSTVFLLTYDENGGFYDHAAPPTPPPDTAAEFVRGAPIGFGNRVPMVVISPWSRGGVVDSEVADHTSVLRFLENWTGVREPNISAWRRQVAGDLMPAFDFAHPDFTSPTIPAIAARTCSGSAPAVPTTQAIPAQEVGVRPTRALPYQPNASARTDCAAGRLYLAMTNTGTASVHYQVSANQYRSDGPWQYDVAPGATVEDSFAVVTYGAGRYDLTLAGPNGFERQFAGDVTTACGALEVSSILHPAEGTIELSYVNRGSAAVTFTTASRIRGMGPWTDTVAAGATQRRTFDLAATGRRWYALVVSASGAPSFRRTFSGHLENGRPDVTLDGRDLVASTESLCADGLDNDVDGRPDCADPDCALSTTCACAGLEVGSRLGLAVATGTMAGRTDAARGSCGGAGLNDAAVAWTAPAAGTYSFDTAGSNRDNDTVVHVHRATCAGAELACNDNTSGTQSAARVTLAAGERVVVVVESRNPTLAWQLNARNVTVCPDRSAGMATGRVATGTIGDVGGNLFAPCALSGRDVSVQWTAPSAGTWRFSTAGSDYDTVLHVRDGACGATVLGCHDDVGGGDYTSQVDVTLRAGQVVTAVISGFNARPEGSGALPAGGTGAWVLNVNAR